MNNTTFLCTVTYSIKVKYRYIKCYIIVIIPETFLLCDSSAYLRTGSYDPLEKSYQENKNLLVAYRTRMQSSAKGRRNQDVISKVKTLFVIYMDFFIFYDWLSSFPLGNWFKFVIICKYILFVCKEYVYCRE